ncbi:MAG: CDP-diacylglycerol--glycerol-3-phosphate 3-phosphatidyltransferase [Akkermansiaceae bacterium]
MSRADIISGRSSTTDCHNRQKQGHPFRLKNLCECFLHAPHHIVTDLSLSNHALVRAKGCFSPATAPHSVRSVNLPNSITFARLILTAIFILSASVGGTAALIVALTTFVIATISDWLDGYLARKLNLVTSLGKLLDPLADKILVTSAFVYFTSMDLCPVWVTCLIIGREFMVTGLRQIAVDKGQIIAADKLGKWKTTFQLAFGITSLLWLILDSMASGNTELSFLETLTSPENWLFKGFLWGALALTLLSGLNYLKKSWKLLLD